MYLNIMGPENSTQLIHDKIITDNNFIGFATDLIQSSVSKIYIVFYYVNIHTTYKSCEIRTFLDVLIQKQKQGLEIKIMLNHPSQKNILYNGLKNSFNYLRENNVPVKRTSQERTTHAKLILCDDSKFIIGSHNFSLTSLHKNREISIFVNNENLCKQLQVYFLENYHSSLNDW